MNTARWVIWKLFVHWDIRWHGSLLRSVLVWNEALYHSGVCRNQFCLRSIYLWHPIRWFNKSWQQRDIHDSIAQMCRDMAVSRLVAGWLLNLRPFNNVLQNEVIKKICLISKDRIEIPDPPTSVKSCVFTKGFQSTKQGTSSLRWLTQILMTKLQEESAWEPQ